MIDFRPIPSRYFVFMDTLKISSQNVRGANNLQVRGNIRSLVSQDNISILFIQETKCSKWNARKVGSMIPMNQFIWVEAPSEGLSGGILTVWNSEKIKVAAKEIHRNWI